MPRAREDCRALPAEGPSITVAKIATVMLGWPFGRHALLGILDCAAELTSAVGNGLGFSARAL
jgi:hypothetical protein